MSMCETSYRRCNNAVCLLGISICKFAQFNNSSETSKTLQKLCLNLILVIVHLFRSHKIKMSNDSSTITWKPSRWLRLEIILLTRDKYINSTWNHSEDSKDIFLWNSWHDNKNQIKDTTHIKDIFLWDSSDMITKTTPSRREFHDVCACEYLKTVKLLLGSLQPTLN